MLASKALRVITLTKEEHWELAQDSKEFREGKIEAEKKFGEGFAKFSERYKFIHRSSYGYGYTR